MATQQPCRGAAQFLLCRNPTSHPPRRFALLFITQTLITPQRMVGANRVRPSKKQVHDYNHCRTEQKNYPITLVGDGAPDVPLGGVML